MIEPQEAPLTQGRRKLPRGGAADRSEWWVITLYAGEIGGRSADHTECSADHTARSAEKFFRLHFQLSGWVLVALSYFED